VLAHLIQQTTVRTRRRWSGTGSLNARAFTSTSRQPTDPGWISCSAGSPSSRTDIGLPVR